MVISQGGELTPKMAIWMYKSLAAISTVCISGLVAHGE